MPMSDYLREIRRMIGTHRLMMPAVSAVIINDKARSRSSSCRDDGNWYVIGAMPDPGEPPALAAVREAFEETGLIVVPEKLLGVYVDPLRIYPNGDEVMYTAMSFRCRPIGGELKVADDESLEVKYFPVDRLPQENLDSAQRLKIEHAVADRSTGYFAWDEAWLKNL